MFLITYYSHCSYSYQVGITIIVSIISFINFLNLRFCFYFVNSNLSNCLLTTNSFSCIKRLKSINRFYICTLFGIFIYVTFILFLELKSLVQHSQSYCFCLVSLEVKVLFYYLFISNFDEVSYLNRVLIYFVDMDFFIYFILRDFVGVPNEWNFIGSGTVVP